VDGRDKPGHDGEEVMLQGLFYEEDSLGVFLLVTVALGGGAAWLTGRAVAQTWRPWWSIVVYMLMLGFAVRFIHFALFGGTLLSVQFYVIDTAVAVVFACLGFRVTRRHQMARQYAFLDAGARQDAAP
jgi:hypothetical protein